MFQFGRSLGVIEGVLGGLKVPVTLVVPRRWQAVMGVRGKDNTRAQAANLLPDQRELFARKKDDGRADAALIALYGHRAYKGEA